MSQQKKRREKPAKTFRHRDDFISEESWNEYLNSLSIEDAHLAWAASLTPAERAEAERISAACWLKNSTKITEFSDPRYQSFARDFDEGRDDEAETNVVVHAETSSETTATVAQFSRVFRDIIGELINSPDIVLSVWTLALHTGIAAQAGFRTSTQLAESIGISKQNITNWRKKWDDILGPSSSIFIASQKAKAAAKARPSYHKKPISDLLNS